MRWSWPLHTLATPRALVQLAAVPEQPPLHLAGVVSLLLQKYIMLSPDEVAEWENDPERWAGGTRSPAAWLLDTCCNVICVAVGKPCLLFRRSASQKLCPAASPALTCCPAPCSFARNVDVETSPDADTPRPCGVALLVRATAILAFFCSSGPCCWRAARRSLNSLLAGALSFMRCGHSGYLSQMCADLCPAGVHVGAGR